MASSRELALILTGKDQSASSTMDKVSDSAGGMAKAIGAAGLVAGGALVGGLVAATKSAADFQQKISGIAAVGGPEAIAAMDQIRAKALQVGKDTSFSASEAATGMEELIKAGVSLENVLGPATDATVALAAATGVDLATAAEVAANAMNTFGLKGQEIAGIADIIAGAANASAIDVNDFKFSLSSAGAVAATVGLTFKETAVAIAELGAAGLKGSDAGTSLKTMLLNLQPTTKAQTEEFTKLGLMTANVDAIMKEATRRGLDLGGSIEDVSQRLFKSITGWKEGEKVTDKMGKAWASAQKDLGLLSNAFFDNEGKIKSWAEIQGILKDSMKGLTDEQRTLSLEILFGTDAIRAASIFVKQGTEGYNEMAASIDKISAADVAKTRLDNLNGTIDSLKGSLETAGIIIGTAFLPSISKIAKAAVDVLNDNLPLIEQLSKTLPKAIETFSSEVDKKFKVAGFAVEAFGKLMSGQDQYLVAFRESIKTIIGSDALDGLVTVLGSKVAPALGKLATMLGTTLPPLLTWLKDTGLPGAAGAAENLGKIAAGSAEKLDALNKAADEKKIYSDLAQSWKDLGIAGAKLGEILGVNLAPAAQDANLKLDIQRGIVDGILGPVKNITQGFRDFAAAVKFVVDMIANLQAQEGGLLGFLVRIGGPLRSIATLVQGAQSAAAAVQGAPTPTVTTPPRLTPTEQRGGPDIPYIIDPSTNTSTGTSTGSIFSPSGGSYWPTALFPSFGNGGMVPGPFGAPMLAVVHGGEEVSGLGRRLGGGDVQVNVNLGGVTVANEADENRLVAKVTSAVARTLSSALGTRPGAPSSLIGA